MAFAQRNQQNDQADEGQGQDHEKQRDLNRRRQLDQRRAHPGRFGDVDQVLVDQRTDIRTRIPFHSERQCQD